MLRYVKEVSSCRRCCRPKFPTFPMHLERSVILHPNLIERHLAQVFSRKEVTRILGDRKLASSPRTAGSPERNSWSVQRSSPRRCPVVSSSCNAHIRALSTHALCNSYTNFAIQHTVGRKIHFVLIKNVLKFAFCHELAIHILCPKIPLRNWGWHFKWKCFIFSVQHNKTF